MNFKQKTHNRKINVMPAMIKILLVKILTAVAARSTLSIGVPPPCPFSATTKKNGKKAVWLRETTVPDPFRVGAYHL